VSSPGETPTITSRPEAVVRAARGRRRRRPTGAPPPLPRSIGTSGKLWLAALAVLLVWAVLSIVSTPSLRITDRVDSAILREIAELRTSILTTFARALDRVGTGWTVTLLILGMLIALMVFRRWRHLLTFLGSLAILEWASSSLYDSFARPRPYGVTIIGRWADYSLPSPPVAALAAVLVGMIYTLVVPGRPRTIGKYTIGVIITAFALARLYLAVDHPLDVVTGAALGIAVPLTAFRLFTPNTVFPVNYRRAKTAHLDVTGRRGEALRKAVADQLGLRVLDIQPIGLEASGGSTPLRLRIAGGTDSNGADGGADGKGTANGADGKGTANGAGGGPGDVFVFGKLYAMSHVRADRWYKLGRMILYGRLEDEAPYKSVRRLVEYEDYALRLLRDVGIPTATPLGVVEITPGREYLLLTSFVDGGVEIGVVDIDEDSVDDTIDQCLMIVRRLWDAGLAHRDIKPANILVRDGQVFLIDPAFMQVRPSPWREAVDLANMMLVLAVRTDAKRVYQRALRLFTPDEIAEAFAAARGVASPTQLRSVLKQDGRDLLAQFRTLAPPRKPIALQRWSLYRVALAAGLLVGTFIALSETSQLIRPAHDLPVSGTPTCGTDSHLLILMSQAVPASASVPCVASLPAGWRTDGARVRRGEARFWLSSDVAGEQAVEVTLQPPERCDVRDASSVMNDEPDARQYERIERLAPGLRTTRYYLVEGGCVTYRFDFAPEAAASLVFQVDEALALTPRRDLVDAVRTNSGQPLCGYGAPPCPGGTGS
jgi:membrane-associated phospholipid phosphatase/tRNA A-37 threonylcarbamoyl transferase component Bud32